MTAIEPAELSTTLSQHRRCARRSWHRARRHDRDAQHLPRNGSNHICRCSRRIWRWPPSDLEPSPRSRRSCSTAIDNGLVTARTIVAKRSELTDHARAHRLVDEADRLLARAGEAVHRHAWPTRRWSSTPSTTSARTRRRLPQLRDVRRARARASPTVPSCTPTCSSRSAMARRTPPRTARCSARPRRQLRGSEGLVVAANGGPDADAGGSTARPDPRRWRDRPRRRHPRERSRASRPAADRPSEEVAALGRSCKFVAFAVAALIVLVVLANTMSNQVAAHAARTPPTSPTSAGCGRRRRPRRGRQGRTRAEGRAARARRAGEVHLVERAADLLRHDACRSATRTCSGQRYLSMLPGPEGPSGSDQGDSDRAGRAYRPRLRPDGAAQRLRAAVRHARARADQPAVVVDHRRHAGSGRHDRVAAVGDRQAHQEPRRQGRGARPRARQPHAGAAQPGRPQRRVRADAWATADPDDRAGHGAQDHRRLDRRGERAVRGHGRSGHRRPTAPEARRRTAREFGASWSPTRIASTAVRLTARRHRSVRPTDVPRHLARHVHLQHGPSWSATTSSRSDRPAGTYSAVCR